MLEKLIKQQIKHSYIYNLDYMVEYNTIKFNVSIELKNKSYKRKVLVALKYLPDKQHLQLITMY
jgi:hypothetical protein